MSIRESYTGDLNVTVLDVADSLVMDISGQYGSASVGDVRADNATIALGELGYDEVFELSKASISENFVLSKSSGRGDILIGQLSADSVVLDMGETPGSVRVTLSLRRIFTL